MRSAVLPLVLVWVAVHAALLGLILGVKFFGAKLALLALLIGAAVWFVLRQPRRLLLPHRPMV